MVHDYQLFMAPGFLRERVPGAVIQHFTHIPWPQPDYWRVLPTDIRTAIHESMLACDLIGLHTPRYVRSLPPVRRAVRPNAQVDVRGGEAEIDGRTRPRPRVSDLGRPGRVRAARRDAGGGGGRAEGAGGAAREADRLRVDRTDPSKNVVRGFSAFDLFLADHPEWAGRVTMLALLDPSRPEIPEYAEYVGAIQRAARDRERPLLHHRRLAADRAAHLRQLPRGRRRLQAVRRPARERDLRRHEPDRQGGAAHQRARRRADPVRERRRPRRARAASRSP